MRMCFGWLCYRIFMAYPHNWPRGPIFGFVLSWAGYYANAPRTAKKNVEKL